MITKYLQFIKESNHTQKDLDSYFLSDEDVKEFFIELTDYGWEVNSYRIILYDYHSFWNNKTIKLFSGILYPTNVNIAYEIIISNTQSTNEEDLTDHFISGVYRLVDYIDGSFHILDEGMQKLPEDTEKIDINSISLNKKIKVNQKEITNICLYVYEKKETIFNAIQIADYYGWEYDYTDGKDVYIDLDFDTVVSNFVSERSYHYKSITDFDNMYDNYYSGDYTPDLDSLFSYYLNNDNSKKIMDLIIEENGGWESIANEIDKNFDSKEDLIKYLIKNPNYISNIDRIDVLDEIISLCGDFLLYAHIDQNILDLIDEFNRQLKKVVDYKIIKDNKGESVYRIKFDYTWYDSNTNFDEDDLMKFNYIHDIMCEMAWDNKFNLSPYFKDYGDFDEKEFNLEVESILKKVV